ncbi:hypothetical protein EJB05_35959, partial [Eragrostis curvula]
MLCAAERLPRPLRSKSITPAPPAPPTSPPAMAWSMANSLLSPEEDLDNAGPSPSAPLSLCPLAASVRTFPSSPAAAPSPTASRAWSPSSRPPRRMALLIDHHLLAAPELDEAEAAARVSEDVIAFARDATMRPELWLDLPLLPDDTDSEGSCTSLFRHDCKATSHERGLAVESLALELADLRIEPHERGFLLDVVHRAAAT